MEYLNYISRLLHYGHGAVSFTSARRLLRYPNAAVMRSGPQAGAFFKNFIVAEILKYKKNHSVELKAAAGYAGGA